MNFACRLGASALAITVAASAAMAQDADWWKQAGEPYQGVTLRGVTESTPPSNYISDVIAPQFEKLTGIRVEIETTSWDQMYDKAIKDMEAGTGIYDMIYIEQDIIYSYLSRDFLVDTTQLLADNPGLKAATYDEANFTTFADYFKGDNGHLYGIPMEAFIKIYLYRTDLFGDPAIQAAYKEATGSDLKPATTHEEYTAISKFFYEYAQANGMENLWGTTVQGHTGHPASWYEYYESIAPTFGIYNWGIDASNNYAATVESGGTMNSDAAKEGLQWWLNLRQYAPPETDQSTWTETGTTFGAGRVAQGLIYGENAGWIAADESKSLVTGKVGVALPPVADGVMADAEGDGYIGYYDGGAFGMPVTSKNKEASMLFLQFMAQNEVQPDWAVAAPRVTHTATYDDPKVVAMNDELGGYYDLLKDKGYLFAGAPAYPFHAQVREATAPIFYDILTGKLSVSDGLDQIAAKTEEELTTLGYRK